MPDRCSDSSRIGKHQNGTAGPHDDFLGKIRILRRAGFVGIELAHDDEIAIARLQRQGRAELSLGRLPARKHAIAAAASSKSVRAFSSSWDSFVRIGE